MTNLCYIRFLHTHRKIHKIINTLIWCISLKKYKLLPLSCPYITQGMGGDGLALLVETRLYKPRWKINLSSTYANYPFQSFVQFWNMRYPAFNILCERWAFNFIWMAIDPQYQMTMKQNEMHDKFMRMQCFQANWQCSFRQFFHLRYFSQNHAHNKILKLKQFFINIYL